MRKVVFFSCLFVSLILGTVWAQNFSGDEFTKVPSKDAGSSVFDEEDDAAKIAQNFKDAIKTNNAAVVARYVEYPLVLQRPLPQIKNEQEFVKYYGMLFDEPLKKAIVDSKDESWESVGWRGIMLDSGLLWLTDEGKLKAINNMTAQEQEFIDNWNKKDRESLYQGLRQFSENIYLFETAEKVGRIDEIEISDDIYSYRLALWQKGQTMSQKPEVMVDGGTVEVMGSAGNEQYEFKQGEETYIFDVDNVGAPSCDLIIIDKNGKEKTYTADLI